MHENFIFILQKYNFYVYYIKEQPMTPAASRATPGAKTRKISASGSPDSGKFTALDYVSEVLKVVVLRRI